MVTEYVMSTEELLELSKGTIRFVIEQSPVSYTDMAGITKSTGVEVNLFLKYTAVSKLEGHKRIIAMKVDIGVVNRYASDFKETIRKIREEAPNEILQYYNKEQTDLGNMKYRITDGGHKEFVRAVKEGAFVNE